MLVIIIPKVVMVTIFVANALNRSVPINDIFFHPCLFASFLPASIIRSFLHSFRPSFLRSFLPSRFSPTSKAKSEEQKANGRKQNKHKNPKAKTKTACKRLKKRKRKAECRKQKNYTTLKKNMQKVAGEQALPNSHEPK